MHILVIADNFVPEIAATSFRTMEHAKRWIERGHEVTVVTCVPNWPHGRPFEGYQNKIYQEETIEGVRVIRLWSYMSSNRGFFRRTLDYVSFMVSAVLQCWRFPRADVILATSPQFFTAVAGFAVSMLHWRPWVFELRDLWPDSIKAVGASDGLLVTLLEKLELFLYRRSTRVLALTNAFRQNLIGRKIDPAKIDVVTNGVDMNAIRAGVDGTNARRKLGARGDQVLAAYIGTTGMAHGLETVLEAAHACRHEDTLHFAIMGEGARREALEQRAAELELDNLTFLDRVSHDQVPQFLAAIDIPIIHLKPDPVFRTVIPSKLFEFMAMRKPVLMAVEGEGAEIVERTKCGVCTESGNVDQMASEILKLARSPQRRGELGQNGYRAALWHYRREIKADEALQSLQLACSEPTESQSKAAVSHPTSKAA
jgi:glycosyltransferase involved in cell wall biosynthesis